MTIGEYNCAMAGHAGMYPRWFYSKTKSPVWVTDEVQAAKLRAEKDSDWEDAYQKQEYPKAKFHQTTGEYRAVANPDEEGKLGSGWGDKPPEPKKEEAEENPAPAKKK
jgi:hypothetical protein